MLQAGAPYQAVWNGLAAEFVLMEFVRKSPETEEEMLGLRRYALVCRRCRRGMKNRQIMLTVNGIDGELIAD